MAMRKANQDRATEADKLSDLGRIEFQSVIDRIMDKMKPYRRNH